MKTEHTQGKWAFMRDNDSPLERNVFHVEGDTIPIFEVIHNEDGFSQTEANAHLIAAAPELLEIAMHLVNRDMSSGELRNKAEKAINKIQ